MEQQNSFNSQQQSTGYMKQPPEMVSVKDSLYLSDMLSWNLNAIKKLISLPHNAKILKSLTH